MWPFKPSLGNQAYLSDVEFRHLQTFATALTSGQRAADLHAMRFADNFCQGWRPLH